MDSKGPPTAAEEGEEKGVAEELAGGQAIVDPAKVMQRLIQDQGFEEVAIRRGFVDRMSSLAH